ncbi:transcriptional regulator, MarR family [Paracidovorax avenae ATCC 19860]|uniref:Transcriptional regulator, MarR family n=1 Tax=Paracidovorax avenae (strain ATCC 19860 / DSM 7227 / CCUG 15838 / JCM 20985 / LMG 2117 / NCPPB 1011) TaxID=643561 RepID=F0Q4E4_PARA1|nr:MULTISPECIES: MarR family transcriptional regulator [Comamonadaceae]ADX44315.1 transcriptional regulator, MarR family [Paracidovorax avenae ATCC 19860]AVS65005.1 MarR family transcriptional regulator [Paracidovorax avenae]MDA8449783.1 MarR family transcriptional regulator [Acidovorax sp. GBBC 3297]MDA8459228.1 MarR family transcriptional regulator [Acidovorax sp. GBBC 3333]MDA8464265.1 MarR family transcriptional regulator [Acidovorax sp. GBBC 3332]
MHSTRDAKPHVNPELIEQSIGYQMRRIVNLMGSEVDRRVEPLGLTDAQWRPLLRIFLASGQESTVAALARVCQLDAGGMTRLLDRLEAKGLCRRERSQEDRRVVNLALTEEGHAAAAQLPEMLQDLQRTALHGFSDAEAAALRRYLARIYENLATRLTPPPDATQ